MSKIAIIGCGIIGATIAYELSLVPELNVTVFEQKSPAAGATSAALGVMMGIISHKVKGGAWRLRQSSMQRYETLIPELEKSLGREIPFNRQGILLLCLEGENLASWEELAEVRRSQGFSLEIWDLEKVKANCPQLNLERVIAGVYSPQDRQVDPTNLTLALVDAATKNGVNFQFGAEVSGIESLASGWQLKTANGNLEFDWLVLAGGLGSSLLTKSLLHQIDIRPVLGQALHLRLDNPLGNPDFQPSITGNDVHIVPVGGGDYWVGATVEFPVDGYQVEADASRLELVREEAIALCPALANATIIKSWVGLRPRPEGRPAPVIGNLPGYNNILLATGHYRNGILLAPATAQAIRSAIGY
ncbi:NAD(P)/FAD-dependent oxidoreductase [Aerosakkonemataceae cyanobacterium BLCC-F154]|uniref:NAD(P)/FAD-dependent oxidoreductase n=1 Tax=Floridaenema fluviatile BLCC-F154 TaxID=3153640 RepID=A0ABV4Y7M5_9CYAN